jgi:DNA-binding NarL/FixJ family response regulator
MRMRGSLAGQTGMTAPSMRMTPLGSVEPQDRPTAASKLAAAAAGIPASPPRILIVDDQPVFRSAARMLLEARGFEVVGEADCAAGALDAAARLAPDGVLLDVYLGEQSGVDVARALTSTHPALPVVLVSSDELESCSERLRESGARAFMLKSRLAATDFSAFWRCPDAITS